MSHAASSGHIAASGSPLVPQPHPGVASSVSAAAVNSIHSASSWLATAPARRTRIFQALAFPACRIFSARTSPSSGASSSGVGLASSSSLSVSDFDLDAVVLAAGGGVEGLEAAIALIAELDNEGLRLDTIEQLNITIAQRYQTRHTMMLMQTMPTFHIFLTVINHPTTTSHMPNHNPHIPDAGIAELVERMIQEGMSGVDPALPLTDVLKSIVKQATPATITAGSGIKAKSMPTIQPTWINLPPGPQAQSALIATIHDVAGGMRRRVLARHLLSSASGAALLQPTPTAFTNSQLSALLRATRNNLFWTFRHMHHAHHSISIGVDSSSAFSTDLAGLIARIEQMHTKATGLPPLPHNDNASEEQATKGQPFAATQPIATSGQMIDATVWPPPNLPIARVPSTPTPVTPTNANMHTPVQSHPPPASMFASTQPVSHSHVVTPYTTAFMPTPSGPPLTILSPRQPYFMPASDPISPHGMGVPSTAPVSSRTPVLPLLNVLSPRAQQLLELDNLGPPPAATMASPKLIHSTIAGGNENGNGLIFPEIGATQQATPHNRQMIQTSDTPRQGAVNTINGATTPTQAHLQPQPPPVAVLNRNPPSTPLAFPISPPGHSSSPSPAPSVPSPAVSVAPPPIHSSQPIVPLRPSTVPHPNQINNTRVMAFNQHVQNQNNNNNNNNTHQQQHHQPTPPPPRTQYQGYMNPSANSHPNSTPMPIPVAVSMPPPPHQFDSPPPPQQPQPSRAHTQAESHQHTYAHPIPMPHPQQVSPSALPPGNQHAYSHHSPPNQTVQVSPPPPHPSLSDARTRSDRSVILAALSFPRCKLFTGTTSPIALTDHHLDMLLADAGHVDAACALLRNMDKDGIRVSSVPQLLHAFALAAASDRRDELVHHLLYPRCTLFTQCTRPIEIEDEDLDRLLDAAGSLPLAVRAIQEFEQRQRKFFSFAEMMLAIEGDETIRRRKDKLQQPSLAPSSRPHAQPHQTMTTQVANRPMTVDATPAHSSAPFHASSFSPPPAVPSSVADSQAAMFPLLHRALQDLDVCVAPPLHVGLKPDHDRSNDNLFSRTNSLYHSIGSSQHASPTQTTRTMQYRPQTTQKEER